MGSEIKIQLSELLSYGREALSCAEAGDWEKVVAAENQNRVLLNQFFEKPIPAEESAQVAAAIGEMLELNDQLQRMTLEARRAVTIEASQAVKGKQALDAYAKNTL